MNNNIFMEKGVFQTSLWRETLHSIADCVVIITDDHVEKLYGVSLKKDLEKCGFNVYCFTFPVGESSKTRKWKEHIENQMLQAALGRDICIISLGGGVVGDLAGFVASTYCRGVPFVSIPTTLLAQVDACIGGKVGVNTPWSKNSIGVFYHPCMMIIDPDFLLSLSPLEILNGIAEIVKYALVFSKDLLKKLEEHVSLYELIEPSYRIKKEIVEKDPFEKGIRRILNFGHTIGHAIETLSNYQISHGQAIAIGMLLEAHCSCQMNYLREEELFAIKALLEDYGFSLSLPQKLSKEEFFRIMKLDKKASSSMPRFVVLEDLGKVSPFDGSYCAPMDFPMLKEALQWFA
ncbi:MAG: 3-dehydroquinate synthase [Parachlamydiales bacterium]|nr:3-dehydroquinate synthase [Parachlamydiales bacterium]